MTSSFMHRWVAARMRLHGSALIERCTALCCTALHGTALQCGALCLRLRGGSLSCNLAGLVSLKNGGLPLFTSKRRVTTSGESMGMQACLTVSHSDAKRRGGTTFVHSPCDCAGSCSIQAYSSFLSPPLPPSLSLFLFPRSPLSAPSLQTGSGKTLAFLLPLFARIRLDRAAVQAIVVVPTRELAMQVGERERGRGRGRERGRGRGRGRR